MATMPEGVCYLEENYQETYSWGMQRSQMSNGQAKQRPTRSRALITRSGTLIIDDYKYEEFRAFLKELNGGTAYFDWYDPIRQKVMKSRFVNAEWNFKPDDLERGDWVAEDVKLESIDTEDMDA